MVAIVFDAVLRPETVWEMEKLCQVRKRLMQENTASQLSWE